MRSHCHPVIRDRARLGCPVEDGPGHRRAGGAKRLPETQPSPASTCRGGGSLSTSVHRRSSGDSRCRCGGPISRRGPGSNPGRRRAAPAAVGGAAVRREAPPPEPRLSPGLPGLGQSGECAAHRAAVVESSSIRRSRALMVAPPPPELHGQQSETLPLTPGGSCRRTWHVGESPEECWNFNCRLDPRV